tara:strand:- start:522 stop:2498 length:1977 start_codon:yes stop_codon:yes gene_type:complete
MNAFIDNLIVDWAWRVNDGMPDPKNRDHIGLLEDTLRDLKYSEEFISEYISQLREVGDEKMIKYKEDGETKEMVAGSAKTMPDDHPAKQAWDSLQDKEGGKEEPEADPTKLTGSDFERTAGKPKKTSIESDNKTISAINAKRTGINDKVDAALTKGYIEKGDAAKIKQFKADFEEFANNPSKEVAEALVEKYNLSQNSSGSKLYLGFLAGDNRKILGQNNKLIQSMGDELNKFVDLKSEGNAAKTKTNALAGASKPDLATKAFARDDEGVQELFSKEPYNRLKDRYHQIFGPKGEDGKILRPSSEHSKAYFEQSVSENTSLDRTIELLDEQGNTEVKTAMVSHKERMQNINKNFDSMSPEERRKAVEDSYSQMAREMHESDPDAARAIMKNVAEMALYDSEIAGGDECYLPSHGSYPSGDKLRVDRNGKGVVEKVAAVSVKFGKSSGGVYGFPGESAQYIKYHPDEEKRDLLKNRVGYPGYPLGVKEEHINESDKFNKLIEEGELGSAFKEEGAENIRIKLVDIQKKIDVEVDKLPKPLKKKALVSIREKLDALNAEAQATIKENINESKLQELIGKHNSREFMKGGSHSTNIIVMAACIKTSDGLDNIEHNHQVINESGLESKTEKGSTNLRKWKFMGRFTDSRGGGLQGAYIGGDN